MMRVAARLRHDTRGVALIEFAMVLPFLILLFVGGFQISDAVFAYRKVTATARTVADLTSQYQSVTNSDLDTVLAASQQVLAPYRMASAEIRVSEITVNSSARGTIDWSRSTGNTTAYPKGSTFVVPPKYKLHGATIVWAEITYHYVPSFASSLIGNIDLEEQVMMYPRQSSKITGP